METIPLPGQTDSYHQKTPGTRRRNPGQILQVVLQSLLRRHRLIQDLNHLMRLDDRLLKDIGVSRLTVKRMLNKNSIIFLDTDLPDCFGRSKSYDFKTIF